MRAPSETCGMLSGPPSVAPNRCWKYCGFVVGWPLSERARCRARTCRSSETPNRESDCAAATAPANPPPPRPPNPPGRRRRRAVDPPRPPLASVRGRPVRRRRRNAVAEAPSAHQCRQAERLIHPPAPCRVPSPIQWTCRAKIRAAGALARPRRSRRFVPRASPVDRPRARGSETAAAFERRRVPGRHVRRRRPAHLRWDLHAGARAAGARGQRRRRLRGGGRARGERHREIEPLLATRLINRHITRDRRERDELRLQSI